MAEIVLVEQGPNFLKVSWKEPDGTGLTHYHLWIHPNDAELQLPITVSKYVHCRPTLSYYLFQSGHGRIQFVRIFLTCKDNPWFRC